MRYFEDFQPGGAIKFRFEVRNQRGEVVMTEVATALFARRPPSTG